MRKLICANLARLWKSPVFWLSVAAILLFSAGSMLNGCRQAAANEATGLVRTLDDFYFDLAPMLGLFCAVFISLFLGTEYSDGTIRNKLVVGHSRLDIYLAELLVCFTASLLFLAAWLVGGLVGFPFLGPWKLGAAPLAVYLLLTALALAAFTALFTWVSTAFTSKAAGAVLSILLFLGLLVLASMLYNRLCEPEMFNGVVITADGMAMGEPTPNPAYLSGRLRTAYDLLLDLLPTGQSIRMANLELAHPARAALFSLLLSVGAGCGGCLMFCKKDLK